MSLILCLSNTHVNFLISRGANSKVSGEDTRVIITNPDKIVSIHRIDNYEIDSISIITVSKVTKTTSTEVIIIFKSAFML